MQVPQSQKRHRDLYQDVSAFQNHDTALTFADEVAHWMLQLESRSIIDPNDMQLIQSYLLDSFYHASSAVLPI